MMRKRSMYSTECKLWQAIQHSLPELGISEDLHQLLRPQQLHWNATLDACCTWLIGSVLPDSRIPLKDRPDYSP